MKNNFQFFFNLIKELKNIEGGKESRENKRKRRTRDEKKVTSEQKILRKKNKNFKKK